MVERNSRSQGFRQSWSRTLTELGVVVAVLGTLLLTLRLVAVEVADRAARSLPPSVDQALGEAAAATVRSSPNSPAGTEPERRRVSAVFDELQRSLTPAERRALGSPRVELTPDPTPNAFALPGGRVFVTTGLLGWLRRGGSATSLRLDTSLRPPEPPSDDEALRGVLAHELGHAVLRHGVRLLARNMVTTVALSWVLGDVGGLNAAFVGAASGLTRLSHSRAMEDEADDFAVALLRRQGRGAEGLARFLESLGAQPVPAMLSTHPDPAARARRIRLR